MTDRIVLDQSALDRLLTGPDGPVAKELTRRAVNGSTIAKRLAPVDTGNLRGSIVHEVGSDGDGLVARFGSNVHYAIHQEMGTSRMRAQPFLRPALKQVTS